MRVKEAVILGVAIILAAAVFGVLFYQSRSHVNTVAVVGSATERFESDIIKWRISISRSVGLDEIRNGYTLIKNDLQVVTDELKSRGINEKDITIQPVNTSQRYDNNGQPVGYELQQGLFVVSGDISKVENLALNPGALFERVFISQSYLEYYFSKLSDIKKQLLAEATKDAGRRAEEIAQNAGAEIDNIESARSGVFQITEPYSTEVSDYGIYSTSTRLKDITVTVRVSFTLK